MNSKEFKIFSLQLERGQSKKEFFTDTSIFLQLKGQARVKINSEKKQIKQGDIFIVNRNESLYIEDQSEGLGLIVGLSISNKYFFSVYEDFASVKFEYFPDENYTQEVLVDFKSEMAKLILAYASHSTTKNISIQIALNKIIFLLTSNFRRESDIIGISQNIDSRIVKILKYIDENYNQKLTLEKLANRFFFSSPTLSKLFKAETNKYFSDYLNEVRIRKSLEDLIYTGDSIENIAIKHGFQNSKTYRSQFKKFLNTTPSAYRNRTREDSIEEDRSYELDLIHQKDRNLFNSLYSYILEPIESSSEPLMAKRHNKLIIDSTLDRDQIRADKIIHLGSLSQLLDMDIKNEFLMVEEDIGIDYIGIHQIYDSYPDSYVNQYSKELGMYPSYGKFDRLVQSLIKKDIGVYYQLKLDQFGTGDRESYNQLLDFLSHIKNMYGEDFMKKIKINFIFNNKNIKKDIDSFLSIKSRLNDITSFLSIGASLPLDYPGYSFNSKEDEESFLKLVAAQSDFLSFSSEVNKIYNINKDMIIDMDVFNEFVYKEAIFLRDLIKNWELDLPIILTEWNTLTSDKQDINGIFFRGAIILQEILKLDLVVDTYGFWLNAGLYRRYKMDKTNKYNGLELFHNYSGKKPIYHVLTIAARLEGKVKFLGSESMLLQNNNDNYQLLLWNPNYFNPILSKEKSFLDSQSILYNLEVPYINDNLYQVKKIDFNRQNGAIFYLYENFNSQAPIDLECHKYVARLSAPKISVFDKLVEGSFDFSCIIDTNAVVLLELKAMKPSKSL